VMIVKPGSTNTMSDCGCEGTVRTGVKVELEISNGQDGFTTGPLC